ncbi:MAG: PSD1 and planctomycete cytochrome C domain-containing protein [Fimbriimonas sp.]
MQNPPLRLSFVSRPWVWLALGFATVSVAGLTPQNAGAPPAQRTPTPDELTFFETRVRPVLVNNCTSCHGKTMQMAGLRLDSLNSLVKGGDSGTSLIPGDPEKSMLIRVVKHIGPIQMPKGKKLKPNEIADLEAWVKMGAPWPQSAAQVKDGATDKPLWSLQPVVNPPVPKVKNPTWVQNPIDSFVLARLEAKKLAPSPAADARALLRRVTYSLTGLPPTAAEVDAFLADKSPTAYEKVVDRLLASPRYGERWARHWLDVARYADTKGYVFEEDRNYYNAYTYRQWVIEALNKDLPYDQFITQQIAADRIPGVLGGDDQRPLAALGFLTVGRRFLNQPPDIMDDRIDVTMRGFQGLTVACARCHDHKFDPIPTQDYYSLYAVFASADETSLPISERAVRDPWVAHNARVAATEGSIRDLIATEVKRLRGIFADAERRKSLSAEVQQALQSVRENDQPRDDNLRKVEKGFDLKETTRLATLRGVLADLKKNAPATPEFAMAMTDRANPYNGVIFKRGNPGNPGDPAPRRFLAALTKPGAERTEWAKTSGRLELAQTIASKENPLTARVFVNRVWLHHFGAGIVRTPSDFGRQGEKPTDPQLLDFLASRFMADGWSIKKLHRLIVTSATYRQSSNVSPAMFNADPENRLWGRMNRRRLDLEQTRDTLMVASGKLDTSIVGGKSVDLWNAPFAPRRAVYGFVERQNLPGTFRTFDFASPDSTNAQRFRTTVPQQALFFMNSPLAVEQARAVMERPEVKSATDDTQRLRRLYRILFGRLPDAEEAVAGLAFLKSGGDPVGPLQVWQYGYGGYDATQKRVTLFTPFGTYADNMYRGGPALPDPNLSYLLINGQGGHPGRDLAHSVVRRWTAPISGTVRISGNLTHGQKAGDGVRARVVSSRFGLLGEWRTLNGAVGTPVASATVQVGDTLDFVVDAIDSENSDAFGWAPKIVTTDGTHSWDATANFGPPPPPAISRWVVYAQALMMTNEFVFVD